MPARDPITSPHLPTASSPQHSTSNAHHGFSGFSLAHGGSGSTGASTALNGRMISPNSSSFSHRTTQLNDEHGQGQDVVAQHGGFSSLLRKVSGSGNGSANGNGRNGDEDQHQNVQPKSRKPSMAYENLERYGAGDLSQSTQSKQIRDFTNRLASLSFTPGSNANRPRVSSISSPPATAQQPSSDASSTSFHSSDSSRNAARHSVADQSYRPLQPSHLNQAVSAQEAGPSRPRASVSPQSDTSPGLLPDSMGNTGRSVLSMMLEREKAAERSLSSDKLDSAAGPGTEPIKEVPHDSARPRKPSWDIGQPDTHTPIQRKQSRQLAEEDGRSRILINGKAATNYQSTDTAADDEDDINSSSALRQYLASEPGREDVEGGPMSERTPLLGKDGAWTGNRGGLPQAISSWSRRMKKVTARDVVRECVQEPIKTIPSVILGLLLNVLDGVSYGMILFPASPVFQDFGSLGVSMFFMSCIVSQLVFSLGGSIFPGGNGSMMIEAVPFFHILVNIIATEVGDDDAAIISTTMMAFAFSSILTGFVFFALGAFKLGGLIGYFPRHILVGCIGGVGIFLIETGLEVSRGLKEEGFEYNLATLKLFFDNPHDVLLWTIPLVLAILLRVITHFYHHQLIFPAYFFVIPIIFYIVVAIGGWDFDHLRETGWVFDVGKNTQAWWKFYTYYDFHKTNWAAFWAAMPTQLALVFFGILHVPLNVPALGVSLGEDNVKLDRELVAHGASNLLAGLTGTVPNYLTYVNTVLFYRVGGGSRLSGLMLAAATGAIMMVGPTVIGYLPVMVVGALIFVLGIDLVIEAVWDTRNRVNRMEYITIWAIAIGMTLWDFVIGLLFGIILACIFFVVQNSRRRAIRTVFNGSTAKSTVRRPRSQRAFIQQVGSQTYVMKLQGFLFFGTISLVEEEIRKLLDLAKWQHNPIRFLILDFALVHGLDFSSAEAFVRVQRLLSAKDVLLILCGASPNGLVGTALQSVDLWADREGTRVEVFDSLNEALEWTENAYLTAFYENLKERQDREEESLGKMIDFPKVAKPPFSLAESFQNSPRRTHLARAGGDTLPQTPSTAQLALVPEVEDSAIDTFTQPLPLLLQTFGSYESDAAVPDIQSIEFFHKLAPYFTQVVASHGTVLWNQRDQADGLYLIESGSLRATYLYDDHRTLIQETMVAGTIAGDLSTLSATSRNATVVAEGYCVLWKLETAKLQQMEEKDSATARRFIKIVLKAVAEEQEVLSSHLIAVLS